MNTNFVDIQLPADLYQQLEDLAIQEETTPPEMLAQLILQAHQQQTWHDELNKLREHIKKEGGYPDSQSKEDLLNQLRQTRREIFEAEYAHLYR